MFLRFVLLRAFVCRFSCLSTTIRSGVRQGEQNLPPPPAGRVRPNTPAGRGLTGQKGQELVEHVFKFVRMTADIVTFIYRYLFMLTDIRNAPYRNTTKLYDVTVTSSCFVISVCKMSANSFSAITFNRDNALRDESTIDVFRPTIRVDWYATWSFPVRLRLRP